MTPVVRKRLLWALSAFLAFWIPLQIGAMFFHVGNGVFRSVSRFVLPPAWIGFHPASYHRVVETAHAFVALGIAPTYQEAFPVALAFVLRDMRAEDLATSKDTLVSQEIFTDADRVTLEAAGISAKEQERYIEDPLLRVRSLDALRNTPLPSQEMRLQNVLEKIDLGMPFTDIARYFSEDSSAMDGGDLGTFLVSDLPVWAQATASMEVGEARSDFVGEDAFWVLKVVDAGGEGAEAWVHIRGIAINKPTLGSLLRAHAAEHPAWVFVW